MSKEIWKTVNLKGFDNYEVSSDGSVRNKKTGTRLMQTRTSSGSRRVGLSQNGQNKNISVDRLVAGAFYQNADDCEIIHKDGDESNNNYRNLLFIEKEKYKIHVIDTRLHMVVGVFDTIKECSLATSTPSSAIHGCLSGKRKSYKGLKFIKQY